MLSNSIQSITSPASQVVLSHLLADEAGERLVEAATGRGARGAFRVAARATAEALCTRATTVSDLRYRLTLLADTLENEDASDYARKLLRAAVLDIRNLTMTGQLAGQPV